MRSYPTNRCKLKRHRSGRGSFHKAGAGDTSGGGPKTDSKEVAEVDLLKGSDHLVHEPREPCNEMKTSALPKDIPVPVETDILLGHLGSQIVG